MQSKKTNMFDIIIFFSIVTLIIVRLFMPLENNTWIDAINFSGIIMAFSSLHNNILREFSGYEKTSIVLGIFVCVIVVLSIIEMLIIVGLLVFTPAVNDIITLITLLISLPTKMYMKFVESFVKK